MGWLLAYYHFRYCNIDDFINTSGRNRQRGVTVSMIRKEIKAALSQEKGSRKRNEWLFVNPYLVIGVVGASLCFTWFFATLTTTKFVPGIDQELLFPGMMHLVFALALLVGYLIVWLLADWLQNHRFLLVVIALIGSMANLLGVAGDTVPFVCYLIAGAWGVSVAALMTLWIEFVCVLLRAQIRTVVATMLALSFLWYAGTVFVDEEIVPYAITGYAFVSGCIYLFLNRRFTLMDDFPAIRAKDSDARLQITWKPSLLTVMGSAAQGFALYWLLMPEVHTFTVSLAIEGLSLGVFALLLLDSQRSYRLKEFAIRRLFLPVLAACILPLFFLPQDFWVWPCILAFLFSLLPYASAIFATCEHIARYNLAAIRTFGWARLFSSMGLFCGLLAGRIAFSTDVLGPMTLPIMVVIVMMFFILVSATISAQSYYPGEEQQKPDRVRIGQRGEIVYESSLPKATDSGVKFFHLKCDAVATQYGLSKRQTEVLHLLAKGRNAEYIQKQLVISPHTAKAHIYNIYQKTGSHSRQDLMDLVEDMVIDKS